MRGEAETTVRVEGRVLYVSEDVDLDSRDEPASGADDHAEPLSELDSQDLALALDPTEATEDEELGFDPYSRLGLGIPSV